MMPPMCLQRIVHQSTETYEKVIHLNIVEIDAYFLILLFAGGSVC